MVSETRAWRIIAFIVALLTMAVPVFVSYDLFSKGNIPEKKIEVHKGVMINLLGDLAALGDRVEMNLTINNDTYDNIAIRQFSLRNLGVAPVTASDFHEPLSVSVDPPWEIISVENDSTLVDMLTLIWERESRHRFIAKPFLLNPGDIVYQTVYLTNTDPDEVEKLRSQKYLKADIYLKARIVNLRRFSEAGSILDRIKIPRGPVIYLEIPAIFSLLVIASILTYWYIGSLVRTGIAKHPSRNSYLLFVAAAALSYSTAEVISYYIFGGYPTIFESFGRNLLDWRSQWQNWAILLLHIIASVYLYRRLKLKVERAT